MSTINIESKTQAHTQEHRAHEFYKAVAYDGGISRTGGSNLARILAAMERRMTELEETVAEYLVRGRDSHPRSGDPPRTRPSVTQAKL